MDALFGSLVLTACVAVMHYLLFRADARKTFTAAERRTRAVLIATLSTSTELRPAASSCIGSQQQFAAKLAAKLTALGFQPVTLNSTTGLNKYIQNYPHNTQPQDNTQSNSQHSDYDSEEERQVRLLSNQLLTCGEQSRKLFALVLLPASTDSGQSLGKSLESCRKLVRAFAPIALENEGKLIFNLQLCTTIIQLAY